MAWNKKITALQTATDLAPFVLFRWLFGAVVLYGGIISILKNDISERFTKPQFYFKYDGWEWVQAPSDAWIYAAYALWLLGAAGLMLGFFYRYAVAAFALSFSYLHLLDASNYINHYYLISILAVFLFFVPAHAECSLDRWRGAVKNTAVPLFWLYAFRLQFALVYTFAGIAKLNADWLFQALPIKIWLLQKSDFPLLGACFSWQITPFIFSWFGAIYDLTISGWLLWRRSRPFAYVLVLIFHLFTALLFDIGLFPPLMIVGTLLFFSPEWHRKKLAFCLQPIEQELIVNKNKTSLFFLTGFFLFQLWMPLRHHFLYDGDIRWTEEGYRWGWRVMLFEKEGNATFWVRDTASGREWEVDNSEFLTPFQIKQMSTKPQHIRQFARYLSGVYAQRFGIEKPVVTADVFVSFNARPSKRLVPQGEDLAR